MLCFFPRDSLFLCDGMFESNSDPEVNSVIFCSSGTKDERCLDLRKPSIIKITQITLEKKVLEDDSIEILTLTLGKLEYEVLTKLDTGIDMFHGPSIINIDNDKYNLEEQVAFSEMAKMGHFHDNQWELRKSGQFCDVEVRFPNGRVLLAHKMVLSSGSSIFLAQFTTTMETSDKDFITVSEAIHVSFCDHLIYYFVLTAKNKN